MKITEPIDVTTGMLIASSIPEQGAGEPGLWVSGTAYTVGQRVRRATTHRIYSKLVDGGDHTKPPEESLDDLWFDEGATNRWAMFQLDRNTASVSNSPISVTVASPGRARTIGLFGVVGQQVSVTVRKDGEVIFQRTTAMFRRTTTTWSEYFWSGFLAAQIASVIHYDLPPVAGVEIEVTVGGGAGPFALSALVIGQSHFIGTVEYSPVDSALNFSRMERAFDGTLEKSSMVRRRTVPRVTLTVHTDKHLVPSVRRLRERLNARVAIYSGLDDQNENPYFEPVLKLGFYRQWDIDLVTYSYAKQQMEIEEI